MATQNWLELATKAHEAGMAALWAASPKPMIVTDSGSGQQWYVGEGVCGFAWVKIKGNTAFGKWAKKVGLARGAYGGGLQIRVNEGGQSMERKEAYAYAYAKTLREAGVEAYSDSRMD